MLIAIGAATLAWFLAAALLFFNPPVDRLYGREAAHPAVRVLPKSPGTIARILGAVFVQCVLWAGVYVVTADALGDTPLERGLVFGAVLAVVKIVPRDIDRVLLTTYPPIRLTIEAVVGVVCAFIVGGVYASLL